MMTKEEILDAMRELFGDRDYTIEQAIENMEEIRDQAQEYITVLHADQANQ